MNIAIIVVFVIMAFLFGILVGGVISWAENASTIKEYRKALNQKELIDEIRKLLNEKNDEC